MKYAVMDIEGIALAKERIHPPRGRYSNVHNCMRKIGIELYDGRSRVFEFVPCVSKNQLTKKEWRAFRYCKKHIHHLDFEPVGASTVCIDGNDEVMNFFRVNDIEIILFKGGTIERDFCFLTGFESRNLEDFGMRKAPKELGHDPLLEVKFYHGEFKKLMSGNILPD